MFFTPFGHAGRFERHVRFNHFVHRDRVKIDMQNGAAERRVLHFLDEGEAAGFSRRFRVRPECFRPTRDSAWR